MKSINWKTVLAVLLSAFFVLGGTLNILASPDILADYDRWGYPAWFHYVTGGLELTAAMLMAIPATRIAGSALAAAVMASAAGTVLLHGEYLHALPPVIVFTLACLNGWLARKSRRVAA